MVHITGEPGSQPIISTCSFKRLSKTPLHGGGEFVSIMYLTIYRPGWAILPAAFCFKASSLARAQEIVIAIQ